MNLWLSRKPKPKKEFTSTVIERIKTIQKIYNFKHKNKKLKKPSSCRQTKNRFLTCELQKLQNNE